MSRFKNRILRTSDFPLRASVFRLPHIVLAILLLQVIGTGAAESQSLDDYLQIAAENNPEVKAYFNEYLAAVEEISQTGALPDPELSVGFFFKPMDRFMGKQQADIRLMQMFPWFGMPGVRREEAGKMSQVRYEGFEDAKNRLFFEVKNKWYELYKQKAEISILEENIQTLKTYERLALIRFQSAGTGASSGGMVVFGTSDNNGAGTAMGDVGGNGSAGKRGGENRNTSASSGVSSASMNNASQGMSAVLRIRMQLKEMESNLDFLQDSQELLKAEFNQLLNRKFDEQVVIADTLESTQLVVERMALLDSITTNNPMLKMLDAEMDIYGSQKEMSRFEGRPMLGLGVNYMLFAPREADGMTMGGKDMVMPMVSVTLPIYRKKYKAMAKEAELNQIAVQQRKENTSSQLAVQWRSSLVDLDDAFRKTNLYREQTALARQALRLLLTDYATNGQDYDDVLQIQQELLNYQLKLVNAVVKQHTAIAILEMLAATELRQ